jgi:alpha-L-fucosidase
MKENHTLTAPAAPVPDYMKWYLNARFGMSLHWGLYSIPARGEWVRSAEQLTIKAYQKYFDSFSPDEGVARQWARLAREAGMRYCVLTAKHHDGFCLFDSKYTDYKATNTSAKRDLIAEYVNAFREEGLRVGLYYSLVDWHHDDYPAWHDRQHPLRDDPAARERDTKCDWPRYVEYLHNQVEELLTNYGTIDSMVFDFSYWEFIGEKWKATELVKRIRKLQPDIVLNDRFGGEPIKQSPRPAYAGDFDQTEQDIPKGPVLNIKGERIPWESWFTLSNSWSYNPNDRNYKQPADIIRALVNCVSKGGNLTLNASPDARGHLNKETVRILRDVGDWMRKNGESIYGCGPAPFEKPEWGRYTLKDGTLYAHVLDQVIGHLNLPGLRGRVTEPRLLADGAEAFLTDYWNPGVQTFDDPDDIFFNINQPEAGTYPLPDPRDTVLAFSLTSEEERQKLLKQYQDDFVRNTTPRNRA